MPIHLMLDIVQCWILGTNLFKFITSRISFNRFIYLFFFDFSQSKEFFFFIFWVSQTLDFAVAVYLNLSNLFDFCFIFYFCCLDVFFGAHTALLCIFHFPFILFLLLLCFLVTNRLEKKNLFINQSL